MSEQSEAIKIMASQLEKLKENGIILNYREPYWDEDSMVLEFVPNVPVKYIKFTFDVSGVMEEMENIHGKGTLDGVDSTLDSLGFDR